MFQHLYSRLLRAKSTMRLFKVLFASVLLTWVVGCGGNGGPTVVPAETDESVIRAEEAAGDELNAAGAGGGV